MNTLRRYSYLLLWLLWFFILDYAIIAGHTGLVWRWVILGGGSALLLYWLVARPGKGSVSSEEDLKSYFGKGQPVVVWLFSNY
jgi:hypothetical protein